MRYLLALLAGLAGILLVCGCGGGSSVESVSGTLYAPPEAGLGRGPVEPVGAGLTVLMATASGDGTILTPVLGAEAVTDANGRFRIPLPSGVTPGPHLNLVYGTPDEPVLSSVVMDLATDVRPATHAARTQLYTAMRSAGLSVGQLQATQVRTFLQAAVSAAAPTESGAGLSQAMQASGNAIQASALAQTALQSAVPTPAGRILVTRMAPEFALLGETVRATITGYNLSDPAPTIAEGAQTAGQAPATVVSASPGTLVVDFAVSAGARGGYHYYTLTRSGATAQVALFVRSGDMPPYLDAIAPTYGTVSASADTAVWVQLTGRYFVAGQTEVVFSATGPRAESITVVSSSVLRAKIVLPKGLAAGNYAVAVRTARGTSEGVLFTVGAGETLHGHLVPVLSSVSPNPITAAVGQAVTVTVTMRGRYFELAGAHPSVGDGARFTSYGGSSSTVLTGTLVIPASFPSTRIPITVVNRFGRPDWGPTSNAVELNFVRTP